MHQACQGTEVPKATSAVLLWPAKLLEVVGVAAAEAASQQAVEEGPTVQCLRRWGSCSGLPDCGRSTRMTTGVTSPTAAQKATSTASSWGGRTSQMESCMPPMRHTTLSSRPRGCTGWTLQRWGLHEHCTEVLIPIAFLPVPAPCHGSTLKGSAHCKNHVGAGLVKMRAS